MNKSLFETHKYRKIIIWTLPIWIALGLFALLNLSYFFMVWNAIESNEQTRILEKEITHAGYHKKMREHCITSIKSDGGIFNTLNLFSYSSCTDGANNRIRHNVYDAAEICKADLAEADYKAAQKLSAYIMGHDDYQIRTTRNPDDPLPSMLVNVVYKQPIYISQDDTRSVETKEAAVARIKAAIDYSILLKKCHNNQLKKAIDSQKSTQSTWQ